MTYAYKEKVLYFEIPKPSDFTNPFIFYYPGCSKNLKEEMALFCPICFKNLKSSFAFPDSSQHIFCSNCLSNWKKYNSTCPMCRKSFSLLNIFKYNRKIIL